MGAFSSMHGEMDALWKLVFGVMIKLYFIRLGTLSAWAICIMYHKNTVAERELTARTRCGEAFLIEGRISMSLCHYLKNTPCGQKKGMTLPCGLKLCALCMHMPMVGQPKDGMEKC